MLTLKPILGVAALGGTVVSILVAIHGIMLRAPIDEKNYKTLLSALGLNSLASKLLIVASLYLVTIVTILFSGLLANVLALIEAPLPSHTYLISYRLLSTWGALTTFWASLFFLTAIWDFAVTNRQIPFITVALGKEEVA